MIGDILMEPNIMQASFVEWLESLKFLGIKVIKTQDFMELLFRFALTIIMLLLAMKIYARNGKHKDFYFSYMALGGIVFLLCFLLSSVKLELGFALGLFAIFGIIRYRTDAIPIKEMTYLFIIIGIAVMNALSNKKVSYTELIFSNSVIIFGLWILEQRLQLKQEGTVTIIYENIANLHVDKHNILYDDLRARTGIEIIRFTIDKVDYLRDVAFITLHYHVDRHGVPHRINRGNIEQKK